MSQSVIWTTLKKLDGILGVQAFVHVRIYQLLDDVAFAFMFLYDEDFKKD